MSPLELALTATALLVVGMFGALWLASVALRDASIVDPCWGLGFVLAAWLCFALRPGGGWQNDAPVNPDAATKPDARSNTATPGRAAAAGVATANATTAGARPWLLLALTTLWGMRLSLFLLWRNWGHGEDRRYAAMRSFHGERFWWVSLFTVFLLQAAILWVVATPLTATLARAPTPPLNWLDGLGVAVWAIGFGFETVGDWQLARFKADPANAGHVCDRGLWRYTRHPNYFGDFCVWWGFYCVAAAGGAAWTVFSPLLMSFLLMRVSGVTLLESTIVDRRPEYADYQRRTNAFFPGPPKRRAAGAGS